MDIIKLQQDLLSLVKRDHDIRRIHDVVDDKFYLANEKGTALYIRAIKKEGLPPLYYFMMWRWAGVSY